MFRPLPVQFWFPLSNKEREKGGEVWAFKSNYCRSPMVTVRSCGSPPRITRIEIA